MSNDQLDKLVNQCKNSGPLFSFLVPNKSFTPASDVEIKLDAVTKLQAEFETGIEVHDTLNMPLPSLSCLMARCCRSRIRNPSSPFSKLVFVLQTNTSRPQPFRPSLRFFPLLYIGPTALPTPARVRFLLLLPPLQQAGLVMISLSSDTS